MKQTLLVSAAVLAVNGQYLRRTGPLVEKPIFDGAIPIVPIDRTIDFPPMNTTIGDLPMNITQFFPINSTFEDLPKNLTKFLNRTIVDLPYWNETVTLPVNRTIDFPRWNETIDFPLDRFPGNGTVDVRAVDPINPHIRPITIEPVERPIYINDPIEEPVALATADDELVAVSAPVFNGTIKLPSWNETVTLPVNRTLEFPRWNETLTLPVNRTLEFPHWNETISLPIDKFPGFNGTFDPRPTIPERPILRFPQNFTLNDTLIPIDAPIDFPITIDDPIERPIDQPIYYAEDAVVGF